MAQGATTVPTGPEPVWREPANLLDWMQRQFAAAGDIFQGSLFGVAAYITRDPEIAYHVLVENWRNYVKGTPNGRVAMLLGNGLMSSEGELWKCQRRMIQPAFHAEALAGLAPVIAGVNERLLAVWRRAAEKGEAVNVTRAASVAALEVILRFLFGADYEEVKTPFEILTREHARNLAFARSFRALAGTVRPLLARRRREAGRHGDALEVLMTARDPRGEAMPEPQLIDEALTLVVAGHETTASTLNWTWYLLAQHPEAEAALDAEFRVVGAAAENAAGGYLRQVIEEVLRLYPPGWCIYRRALAEDRLGRYLAPAGMEVYISPYFIQRHPLLWPEPARFDPGRFRPELTAQRPRLAMMPFSAGPRNCIGERLARLEMAAHLALIASQLRLGMVGTAPLELEVGVNLRNRHDFLMRPELKPAAAAASAATGSPGI